MRTRVLIAEAAVVLEVSRATVYRWLDTPELGLSEWDDDQGRTLVDLRQLVAAKRVMQGRRRNVRGAAAARTTRQV